MSSGREDMRYILNSSLFLFVMVVSFSIISTGLDSAFADSSLDGKTFSVQLSEHGKKGEPTDDELIFKDGTFFSTDCEQYGFGSSPYETRTKGDLILFKSTLTSEKEGKGEWEGRVSGDKISGLFIWSKAGQDPIIYEYEGSIKK